MTANIYDWTRFKKKIYIDASVEQVYQAWVQPGKIVQWFIAEAEYRSPDGAICRDHDSVQVGDQYFWRWHQDLSAEGEIVSVHENQSLAFTFGENVKGSGEMILVTVTFSQAEDGRTVLELVQDNMADTVESYSAWHLGCNLGWSFFMTNLKAYLEHGIDLRESGPEQAYQSRAISLV